MGKWSYPVTPTESPSHDPQRVVTTSSSGSIPRQDTSYLWRCIYPRASLKWWPISGCGIILGIKNRRSPSLFLNFIIRESLNSLTVGKFIGVRGIHRTMIESQKYGVFWPKSDIRSMRSVPPVWKPLDFKVSLPRSDPESFPTTLSLLDL